MISAYELLDCVSRMTDEQRDELTKLLSPPPRAGCPTTEFGPPADDAGNSAEIGQQLGMIAVVPATDAARIEQEVEELASALTAGNRALVYEYLTCVSREDPPRHSALLAGLYPTRMIRIGSR